MSSGSGVKTDALALSGANSGIANTSATTAIPQLQQLSTGTVGISPTDRAGMLTRLAQTLGGSQSGAVGAGGLLEARTGQAGGEAAAIDDAARSGVAQQSQVGLNIDQLNQNLEQQNREIGLSGLQSYYGTGTTGAISALNTANQAQKPFWQQLLQSGVQGASEVGAAYAGK